MILVKHINMHVVFYMRLPYGLLFSHVIYIFCFVEMTMITWLMLVDSHTQTQDITSQNHDNTIFQP